MYFYACMGIKDGMGRNGSNSNINVHVVATRNEMVDAMMVLSSIRIICDENSRRN